MSVLDLSGAELRTRLVRRGWPDADAESLVRCARGGCPECAAAIIEAFDG